MILLIHLNTLPQEVGLQSQLPSMSSFTEAGTKHWCITGENYSIIIYT